MSSSDLLRMKPGVLLLMFSVNVFAQAGNSATSNAIIRDKLESGQSGPELVVIPAGQYQMGDRSGIGFPDEYPVHQVDIRQSFAIGRFEVTFDEYDYFAASTGRPLPVDNGWGRGRRPVINVSRIDAMAYAKWMSKQTGEHYRLPSESEWEYAARADGEPVPRGNYKRGPCTIPMGSSCPRATIEVGSFENNSLGIFDMAGNVAEWVRDCYHDDYIGAPANEAPRLQCDFNIGVVRGGSWGERVERARPAGRNDFSYGERSQFIGFRIARDMNNTGALQQ